MSTNHVETIKNWLSKNHKPQWVIDNCLFLHYSGSTLYGTNNKDSDTDVRGVTIAPKEYWVGTKQFEQEEFNQDGLDCVIWDFRKFLNLIVRASPNVLESLYVPDDYKIIQTEQWNSLLPQMKNLVSQLAFKSFHGYSTGQLKQMSIKQANKTGRQYISKAMGFDTKFASHAFRLIYQGEELMLKNEITFPRPEAQILKDIRNGVKYNQNQQMQCIADWEIEQNRLERAKENTVLPERTDDNLYNSLLISTFDRLVNVHNKSD